MLLTGFEPMPHAGPQAQLLPIVPDDPQYILDDMEDLSAGRHPVLREVRVQGHRRALVDGHDTQRPARVQCLPDK